MKLLDAIKLDLGIKHGKKDRDVADTIKAACLDLNIAGVRPNKSDALVRQAVKLYCRAFYNYQGMSERWQEAYEALKRSLALSGSHREENGDAQ